jgi:hypothetical protein
MISFLESILEVISNLGIYIVASAVTVINLVFDGFDFTVEALLAVLPEIPVPEAKIANSILEEANWWYPFGDEMVALTAALTMLVVWIGVRFMLKMLKTI